MTSIIELNIITTYIVVFQNKYTCVLIRMAIASFAYCMNNMLCMIYSKISYGLKLQHLIPNGP